MRLAVFEVTDAAKLLDCFFLNDTVVYCDNDISIDWLRDEFKHRPNIDFVQWPEVKDSNSKSDLIIVVKPDTLVKRIQFVEKLFSDY